MNNNPTITPQVVNSPFKNFCMSVGAIPTSYQDSLDYYETLLWLIKFLDETVIPAVSTNGNAVAELQSFYVQLQSYVNNYFDNLDVQEEINNKLDEMAQDGSLENIIALYINKEVEYIFPKFYENSYSQDVCLIKGYDKNILIDSGLDTDWDNTVLMLSNNFVEHIDYFILSHYDKDHYGNINNLIIHNYINSDTIVYLPVVPDRYGEKQTIETQIKALLNSNNISYTTPTENYVLSINDELSIKFGNVTKSYMETNYDNYNYCSMVCLIKHKNNYSFYAGDAGTPTFKFLYDNNFINQRIDLYKQAHHGIDVINKYLILDRIMSPKFTVQIGGINDFIKNNFLSEETSFLINLGTVYYPTYMQSNYLIFASNGSNLYNKSGKSYSYSGQRLDMNLYVDATASNYEIQDGTQEHPFKELMQAIGYIQNFPAGKYNIYLADGNYGFSHEASPTHVKNRILINSNNNIDLDIYGNSNDNSKVVLNGVYIYNANVVLNNLTISNINYDGIICRFSNLALSNVKITNPDNESTTHTGILLQNSKCYVSDSEISYCNHGITVGMCSILSHSNVTFNNITYSDILKRNGDSSGYISPKELLNEASNSTTIQLNSKYTGYDYLIISFHTNDYIFNTLTVYNPTLNKKLTMKTSYSSLTDGRTYDKECIMTLSNDNTITLGQSWQTSFAASTNQTVNKTQINNPFTIDSVKGIYTI